MVLDSFKSILGSRGPSAQITVSPVQDHEIEISTERRARTVKHLIKANHATKAIIGKDGLPNNLSILLGAAYLLNVPAELLIQTYDSEEHHQMKWEDSPSEITLEDWTEYLGSPNYQRAFIDFFEDQLVRFAYDWKAMINYFLFDGEKPLIYSLIAGNAQPMIHLAYAIELSSKTLAIEALAMTCCLLDTQDKYITEIKYNSRSGSFSSQSPIAVFNEIAQDSRLDGIRDSAQTGASQLELSKEHEDVVLEYWHALEFGNLTSQFEEMQRLAVALAVSLHKSVAQQSPLTRNLLHGSRAVRVLLPRIPGRFRIPLIRQWWLLAITTYICNGRVQSATGQIAKVDSKDNDWKAVEALVQTKGLHDVYFLGDIVSIRQMADTWGDSDRYYLKAALLYGEE